MYKLEFTLKQHTPIIHFQHNQDGATLRATEVKPKLDRFIIEKFGGSEAARIAHPGWFSSFKHDALNYNIRFQEFQKEKNYHLQISSKEKEKDGKKYAEYNTGSYPLFIANMGGKLSESELKNFSYSINLKLVIIVLKLDLKKQINDSICDFFLQENFGNRQSKGFGCFYPDEDEHGGEEWYKQPSASYHFDVYPNEQGELNKTSPFYEIELFYRTLRGGLNLKKKLHNNRDKDKAIKDHKYHRGADGNDYRNIFYFKSLMFLYAKNFYNANWEKRKIKEEFFPTSEVYTKDGNMLYFRYPLDEQEMERPTSDQLTFKEKDFHLFRDILGLSTEESWKSYKSEIQKSQAQLNRLNEWKSVPLKDRTFDRFKSPILFKPFEMVDENDHVFFRVFIILQQGSLDMALNANKDFLITSKDFLITSGKRSFHITYPTTFSLHEYFKFFLDTSNFDIFNHVEIEYYDTDQFDLLNDIFNQLRNNNQGHE